MSDSPLVTIDAIYRAKRAFHGMRKEMPPFGLCVHTTGSGVPVQARERGITVMERALEIYTVGPNAAHYVIDHDGVLAQVVPENVIAWHAGRYSPTGIDRRPQYLSGEWEKLCSPAAVASWKARWGAKYKSPQHLYPGESANAAYVGVELVPTIRGLGTPSPTSGGVFTDAQYEMLIKFAANLAARHKWPADWAAGARLLGHEDVGLIDRHDRHGGWDPGFLKDKPVFDFPRVRAALAPT